MRCACLRVSFRVVVHFTAVSRKLRVFYWDQPEIDMCREVIEYLIDYLKSSSA